MRNLVFSFRQDCAEKDRERILRTIANWQATFGIGYVKPDSKNPHLSALVRAVPNEKADINDYYHRLRWVTGIDPDSITPPEKTTKNEPIIHIVSR